MARKSRGEVEEGYADFNGETSRSISFDLKATGEPRFTSPPVVKLVSIERLNHLYKWFFFDRDGSYAVEWQYLPADITVYGYGAAADDKPEDTDYDPTSKGPFLHTEASGYGNVQSYYPYQKEFLRLDDLAMVGISFEDERRAAPGDSDTLYLYFQVWFKNIDVTNGFKIYWVNSAHDWSTRSANIASSASTSLTWVLQLEDWTNIDGWTAIANGTGYKTDEAEEQDVDGVSNGISDQEAIRWVRLKLSGSGLSNIGKFIFECTDSDDNDFAFFANPIIQYGSVHSDGFTFNPNLGVSFSSVTQSGMTIECTAKLHGRIRYLMSL